jgi:hypothetical protein
MRGRSWLPPVCVARCSVFGVGFKRKRNEREMDEEWGESVALGWTTNGGGGGGPRNGNHTEVKP